MKNLLTLLCLLFLNACAFGPLALNESAKPLGKDKNELSGAYGTYGYAFRWHHGVTDRLDLGIQLESLSFGIKAKYNFLETSDNVFLSGGIGAGISMFGNYKNLDILLSKQFSKVDLYSGFRLNFINTDATEFNDEDTGELQFTVDANNYTYGHLFFGAKYLASDKWTFNLETSYLISTDSNFDFESNGMLIGIGTAYQF